MSEYPDFLPQAKPLTLEEIEEQRTRAYELEAKIKLAAIDVHKAEWQLAEYLYEMQELRGWKLLGLDTVEEWLAQPELGFTRRWYEINAAAWKQLVVIRDAKPASYQDIEMTKVAEVLPAITRGDVEMDEALSDAREMGKRDLREQYRHDDPGRRQLAPSKEPELVQCPNCSTWVDPHRLHDPEHVIEGSGEEKSTTPMRMDGELRPATAAEEAELARIEAKLGRRRREAT